MQLFANPGKAAKKSSIEIQQMEAQMQHNHVLHVKSLGDRDRHAANLALQMAKKAKLNAQLQEQAMSLAELMDDQLPVMEAVLCKKDPSRCACLYVNICFLLHCCIRKDIIMTREFMLMVFGWSARYVLMVPCSAGCGAALKHSLKSVNDSHKDMQLCALNQVAAGANRIRCCCSCSSIYGFATQESEKPCNV